MADEVTYQDDIVAQLRRAAQWTMLNDQRHMLDVAADEIERLRSAIHLQGDQGCVSLTVAERLAGDNDEIARLHSALAEYAKGISEDAETKLTLTEAEREAVERAVGFCECTTSPLPTSQQIATLRGLLGRTR